MENFKLGTAEKIAKEELDHFWKKLRHFYRTGGKFDSSDAQDLQPALKQIIPQNGSFPFSINNQEVQFAPHWYHKLLNHHLESFQKEARRQFESDLSRLIIGLSKQLGVKEIKADDKELYDFATEIIAFEKLNEVVPSQPTTVLSEVRRQRWQQILEDLKEGLKQYDNKEALILHLDESLDRTLYKRVEFRKLSGQNAFQQVQDLVKEQMTSFTRLIRAFRIAILEVDGEFKEDIHTEFFEHFNW